MNYLHKISPDFKRLKILTSCYCSTYSRTGMAVGLDLDNPTDVPATHVFAESMIQINGQRIPGSKLDIGVIVKGNVSHMPIFLTEKLYESATNEQNRFEIELKMTYSGMLGERQDEYETLFSCRYLPKEKSFGYLVKNFR